MFTKADIEKYFNAEKAGSWIFISIGIAAVIAALVFQAAADAYVSGVCDCYTVQTKLATTARIHSKDTPTMFSTMVAEP